MKYLSNVLALLAAVAGFAAAFALYRASNAGSADYTGLGTEPGMPEGSHNYHALANTRGATRSGKLNKWGAYWSASGALLSLPSGIASLWLLI